MKFDDNDMKQAFIAGENRIIEIYLDETDRIEPNFKEWIKEYKNKKKYKCQTK